MTNPSTHPRENVTTGRAHYIILDQQFSVLNKREITRRREKINQRERIAVCGETKRVERCELTVSAPSPKRLEGTHTSQLLADCARHKRHTHEERETIKRQKRQKTSCVSVSDASMYFTLVTDFEKEIWLLRTCNNTKRRQWILISLSSLLAAQKVLLERLSGWFVVGGECV